MSFSVSETIILGKRKSEISQHESNEQTHYKVRMTGDVEYENGLPYEHKTLAFIRVILGLGIKFMLELEVGFTLASRSNSMADSNNK